jgi:SPP1 family predicted phage head-tail adaptor
MQAGKLRHRITIQSPTETRDDHGQAIKTWSTFATVNGSIVPESSREFWSAKQTQADITHLFSIRYLPGVTSRMRIAYGSRVFQIGGVINVGERNVELHLACTEPV